MKSFGRSLRKICYVCLLALIALAPVASIARSATTTSTPIAPNTPLRFGSLSLEQGLSQSVVNVTFQDSQGYLWFGTQDGLNRYDGYHFTIFRPDPDDPNSISDRLINDITEDNQGNLWIGTMLGSLNRYNLQTGFFTHFVSDPQNTDSLGGNCIRALFVDQNGMLWIGSNGGLDVYDPKQDIFVAHYRNNPEDSTSLPNNEVNGIKQDRSGVMWITTHEGLAYQDQIGGSFKTLKHNPDDKTSLISNDVGSIFEDQSGNLWLGTDMGLERLDRQTLKFEHFTPDPSVVGSLSNPSVSAILEDHNNNLWVGTADGLNLLDRQSGRFTIYRQRASDPTSLSNSLVLSLYEDNEGILWVGTFGGGANKLDPGRNKFPILQYDAKDPQNISSFGLIEDHMGQLWFTIYGTGLLRLNRETGDYTLYHYDPMDPDNSLIDNFVWNVSESHDGMIWIGSRQGLNVLNPVTGKFTHYQRNQENTDDPKSLGGLSVSYTLEDSRGNIWIALLTGLDCFDRSTGIFTHYRHDPSDPSSIGYSNLSYIFESSEGDIWLGMSESGLSRLNQVTGKFTHYYNDPNDPQSISSNGILVIMQDHSGTMWLGTNEGLNRFDPQSGKAKRYTVKEGLPNNVVYAIVEDDQGYLWLSTNYGLSRFDPRTESFRNFDYNDGLQSNEFNSLAFAKTRAGDIIFSGITGTNIFRPGNIQDNSYVPPIVLTKLTQGGEPVKVEQASNGQPKVTLNWPHNYFEFEFAALSFSNSEKNQYAYLLEKFDQDWVTNSTYNFGRYTNLPGGTYTLRIKGSNNDGIWNEAGTAITVTVVPPFWQTWWLRGGVVLFVAAAVFAIYRLRVRNMESYNRNLKQQVEERTQEIENLFEQTKELAIIEERNRLARDLHDSAKQKAFAALAQLGAVRSMMTRESSTAKSHLDEVEDLVYEVIQELTFLIQEMYPMALKEKGLTTILREYLYEWENRNEMHVNLIVNHEHRMAVETEQALYRIAQESLANIARHSHATQVNIELNYNQDSIQMAVIDNGCGFDLGQKPAGVGLRTMQERAAMIGGNLEIDSSPGKGTQIRVSAPAKQIEKSNFNGDNGGHNGSSNHNPDRR